MIKQDLAILFSGGPDCLSLYVLAALGKIHDVPSPRMIHLVHMLNRMVRFPDAPRERFKAVVKILEGQVPPTEPLPAASFIELDMGRLLQELWLLKHEELMPRYGGKNLVCVACHLAMNIRAVIYCVEHAVPNLLVGYSKKQSSCPHQSEIFLNRIADFSECFGVITRFPLYNDFDKESIPKLFLADHGLPSDNGGKGNCLFSEAITTATEREVAAYLDDMLPRMSSYVESRLEGRSKDSASCFD